jgi:hypothetical protein
MLDDRHFSIRALMRNPGYAIGIAIALASALHSPSR